MKYLSILVMMLLLQVYQDSKSVHIPNGIVLSRPTELERFLRHIGERESNNTVHIVNRFGMMGKYQFSPQTVRWVLGEVDQRVFLGNAELQDTAMVRYMRKNNETLRDLISRYEGTTFKGVRVTRAGILAAAHLAGPGGVRHYFASNDQFGRKDANGTSVKDYMELFADYSLAENF